MSGAKGRRDGSDEEGRGGEEYAAVLLCHSQ